MTFHKAPASHWSGSSSTWETDPRKRSSRSGVLTHLNVSTVMSPVRSGWWSHEWLATVLLTRGHGRFFLALRDHARLCFDWTARKASVVTSSVTWQWSDATFRPRAPPFYNISKYYSAFGTTLAVELNKQLNNIIITKKANSKICLQGAMPLIKGTVSNVWRLMRGKTEKLRNTLSKQINYLLKNNNNNKQIKPYMNNINVK